MDDKGVGILGDWEATGEQIREAWERAVLVAMENHRRTGVPVATWDWENQCVVLTPAEEFLPAEEHALIGPTHADGI